MDILKLAVFYLFSHFNSDYDKYVDILCHKIQNRLKIGGINNIISIKIDYIGKQPIGSYFRDGYIWLNILDNSLYIRKNNKFDGPYPIYRRSLKRSPKKIIKR